MSASDIKRLTKVLSGGFVACSIERMRLGGAPPGPEDYHIDLKRLLHAMREPTESQYDALCATDKMWREQTSETVWKTYIDALLTE